MAARRTSICRRYPFQPIENQHLIGHSIEFVEKINQRVRWPIPIPSPRLVALW